MNRVGNVVEVSFASEEERARANDLLRNTQPDLVLSLPDGLPPLRTSCAPNSPRRPSRTSSPTP